MHLYNIFSNVASAVDIGAKALDLVQVFVAWPHGQCHSVLPFTSSPKALLFASTYELLVEPDNPRFPCVVQGCHLKSLGGRLGQAVHFFIQTL